MGLAAQSKTFFSDGIQKLLQLWTKCMEKQEGKVEKLCTCEFCIVVFLILMTVLWILFDLPTNLWTT
jgi:hypothetical protein